MTTWKLLRNAIGPFHVERITYGPHYKYARESPPQVCDAHAFVAISTTDGAVFCASDEHARRLCALANAGRLERH